jgi:hypothetical protein
MEPNEVPATPIAPTIPKRQEEALWFAYQELLENHKELIHFAKAIGVYDLYEPKQYFTTH